METIESPGWSWNWGLTELNWDLTWHWWNSKVCPFLCHDNHSPPLRITSSCWSTGRRKSTSTLRWPSQNASGIGRRRQLGLGSLGSCRLRNPGWFGLHLWYLESFLYFFSLKHQWFSNIFCKTGTPEWSRLGSINPGLTSWNIIILFVDQKWPMLESADQPVVGPGDGPFRRTFQRESPSCSTSWRSEAHGVAWNAMNSVKLEVNRIDGSALKLFFHSKHCQTDLPLSSSCLWMFPWSLASSGNLHSAFKQP